MMFRFTSLAIPMLITLLTCTTYSESLRADISVEGHNRISLRSLSSVKDKDTCKQFSLPSDGVLISSCTSSDGDIGMCYFAYDLNGVCQEQSFLSLSASNQVYDTTPHVGNFNNGGVAATVIGDIPYGVMELHLIETLITSFSSSLPRTVHTLSIQSCPNVVDVIIDLSHTQNFRIVEVNFNPKLQTLSVDLSHTQQQSIPPIAYTGGMLEIIDNNLNLDTLTINAARSALGRGVTVETNFKSGYINMKYATVDNLSVYRNTALGSQLRVDMTQATLSYAVFTEGLTSLELDLRRANLGNGIYIDDVPLLSNLQLNDIGTASMYRIEIIGTALTSFSLIGPQNFQSLFIHDNINLVSLSLDLRRLKNLETIDVADNSLLSQLQIPLVPSTVKTMYLNNNRLTSFDLATVLGQDPGLSYLSLSGDPFNGTNCPVVPRTMGYEPPTGCH